VGWRGRGGGSVELGDALFGQGGQAFVELWGGSVSLLLELGDGRAFEGLLTLKTSPKLL
jgi:hypothetical protein